MLSELMVGSTKIESDMPGCQASSATEAQHQISNSKSGENLDHFFGLYFVSNSFPSHQTVSRLE